MPYCVRCGVTVYGNSGWQCVYCSSWFCLCCKHDEKGCANKPKRPHPGTVAREEA